MVTRQAMTLVGKVAKAHGYKGAVRVDLINDFSFKFSKKKQEPVFLELNQKLVPFFYDSFEDCGTYLLIHFEDFKSDADAREILGAPVLVANENVEQTEEFSPADLIDYTVVDSQLGRLGFIQNYMETPAQVLLYMMYNGREVMIPFVDEFIDEINDETRELHTTLPEGLLDV